LIPYSDIQPVWGLRHCFHPARLPLSAHASFLTLIIAISTLDVPRRQRNDKDFASHKMRKGFRLSVPQKVSGWEAIDLSHTEPRLLYSMAVARGERNQIVFDEAGRRYFLQVFSILSLSLPRIPPSAVSLESTA